MALSSLCSEREFRKTRMQGRYYKHPLFTLRLAHYRPAYGQSWHPHAVVGIVVPKKVLKRAVDRNRVRRRLREALRTLPSLPACRAVFYPTPAVLEVPFADLQIALIQALKHPPKRSKTNRRQPTGDRRRA